MKPFTVILLRPDYIADPYGQDVYVATITAKSEYAAIEIAQKEAFDADKTDSMEPDSMKDYAMLLVFSGHPEIKLFGWMI